MSLKPGIFVTCVFCLAFLGACGLRNVLSFLEINYTDPGETPGPEMPPAPLPEFRAGDFYEFDNGVTYKVVATDAENVSWMIGDSFRFSTLRNILYPWMAWESKSSAAHAETDDPTRLWPLKVGNSGRLHVKNYFYKYKDGSHIEYFEERDCQILSTAKLRVPAGTFDTFKIRCNQYINNTVYMGTTFYYYAHRVGYFVKEINFKGHYGKGSVRQLTSFGVSLDSLPKEDRANLYYNFQLAMNTRRSGERVSWSSADGRQRSTIIPTTTFILDSGQVCRNYSQYLHLDGRQREFVGRACRDDRGVWVAP